MKDHLRRSAAPLSERTWKAIDEAVAQAARHVLAGRRVATFDGPKGWDHVADRLGTMMPCRTREGQAAVCVPEVVLLTEIRVEFSLPWTSIDVFERGAPALDTRPAEAAAREAALAEDRLVLYGDPVGTGFLGGKESPHVEARDWSQPGAVLSDVLRAVEALDGLGIPGPYEALLQPARYYQYLEAAADGYPAARQLREVVGHVHRAGVLREVGALFSTRGCDFLISVGGDLSVGFKLHDRESIHLFCVETLAAHTVTPEAVCRLDAEGDRAP